MRSIELFTRYGVLSCVLVVSTVCGCGDSDDPPALGAFTATFSGGNCPATVDPGPTTGVGKVSKTTNSTVADGTDGARISCRVAKNGDTYRARISISQGQSYLEFDADLISGQTTTTRSLSLTGPSTLGKVYSAPADQPCDVTFVKAKSDGIWAGFSCAVTKSPSDPSSPCAVYEGWVAVESCS